MPLNARNQRSFHRKLLSGKLETIHLLKREDDQREGIVKCVKLFACWHGPITKTAEPIAGDMTADHSTTWHIPRQALKRVGVKWLNALDRIRDKHNRYWQPEATTLIIEKLAETHIDLYCLRVDPPNIEVKPSY